MFPLTDSQHAELKVIALRHSVKSLELFGSATTPGFDPARSDVDVLVEFLPEAELGPWLSGFFDLKADLEQLFGRSVDLLETDALQNPWLKQEIEKQRILLYAA